MIHIGDSDYKALNNDLHRQAEEGYNEVEALVKRGDYLIVVKGNASVNSTEDYCTTDRGIQTLYYSDFTIEDVSVVCLDEDDCPVESDFDMSKLECEW